MAITLIVRAAAAAKKQPKRAKIVPIRSLMNSVSICCYPIGFCIIRMPPNAITTAAQSYTVRRSFRKYRAPTAVKIGFDHMMTEAFENDMKL